MKKYLPLSILLLSNLSHAAAFQSYELGAPLNGTAAVGQAVVSDASIAYFNPAGMAFLPNTEIMIGSQLTLPYTNFSPSSANTIPGNNGGNASNLIPSAGTFFVSDYSSKIKFGGSLTAPYGGMLNYNDHWVGRYFAQQMTFFTVNLNPAASYQINEWLAIGAGISIEYANLYQTVALPIASNVDGQLTVKLDNFSPGFNLGAFIKPTENTKIGIAYRSQIIHNLRGDSTFFNVSVEPNTSTKLVMPANVMASIYQKINNKMVLLGELGWSNWSSMKNSIVVIDGFSLATPQNWEDTYRVGLGTQYQAFPCLLLQTGISYDSSPTNSAERTPNLPMDRQLRVAAGAIYTLIKGFNLGFSYEYINLGKAGIQNVSKARVLAGSYSRNYANIVQTSLNIDL